MLNSSGAQPGSGSGGNINLDGGAAVGQTVQTFGSAGGVSYWGGAGAPGFANDSGNYVDAGGYGSGGGGSASSTDDAGDGAGGICVVEEYK